MEEAELLTERLDDVLVITINRPHARNAINQAVYDGIGDAFTALDADPELRAGVLCGAGGFFCAGMDLKAFAGGMRLGEDIVRNRPRKPVVAAIEAFALAGGLELALTCDLVVASRGALFGLPEVTRGIFAAGGGVFRLARRMPYHVAMGMILTGDPISAEEAAHHGLINQLVEPGGAVAAALVLAARVAQNAPLSVEASLTLARGASDWTESQAWAEQNGMRDFIFESHDALEGSTAFAERRKPKWMGM